MIQEPFKCTVFIEDVETVIVVGFRDYVGISVFIEIDRAALFG